MRTCATCSSPAGTSTGLGLYIAQDIQRLVERAADLAADAHDMMSRAGSARLHHHLRGVELADFSTADHRHLGTVDRHIHFGLLDRLPAGQKTVNSAGHVPAQVEFSRSFVEGKITDGG